MPKMTIILSEDECNRLVEMAEVDKRHPRDEAVCLLQSVLFGNSSAALLAALTKRVEVLEEALMDTQKLR